MIKRTTLMLALMAGSILNTVAQPLYNAGDPRLKTYLILNARFKFDICRPDGGACLNY